jgi:hypothetical protein
MCSRGQVEILCGDLMRDYDRGDLMRESDSDGESMGDSISDCDDSEGCYEDQEDRLHAKLGEASVPMSESAGVRALFPCL